MYPQIQELINQILKKYDIKKIYNLITEILKLENELVLNHNNDLLDNILKIANLAFQNKNYSEACELFLFLTKFNNYNETLREFLLKEYYLPFEQYFKENYEKNISILNNYEYLFEKINTNFNELSLRFLPLLKTLKINNQYYGIYNEKTLKFNFKKYQFKSNELLQYINSLQLENKVVITIDIFDISVLTLLIKQTNFKPLMWEKKPLYLFYHDKEEFLAHLQICNFYELIKFQNDFNIRCVFIFGIEHLKQILSNKQYHLPQIYIKNNNKNTALVESIINNAINANNSTNLRNLLNKLENYYNNIKIEDIINKIEKKEIKIGFVTSRFTTALQYYIRDLILACNRLGINNCLLIEESDICIFNTNVLLEFIDKHKPDILFIPDHHRIEYQLIPQNLIYVCWIIDIMPNLFSPAIAKSLTKFDFVISMFCGNSEFDKVGYPKSQLINGPILCDHTIYKKYELSDEEIKNYSTDICIISNSGNFEESFNLYYNFLKGIFNFTPEIKAIIENIAYKIYDDVYNEKEHYFDYSKIKNIIRTEFNKNRIFINESILDEICRQFKVIIVACIYKTVYLMWLHEAKFNFKIWGKSWTTHSVLKKYAMGQAQNGEVLSKILNACKISLGLNIDVTFHPRVLETFLSESLYIGNIVPIEYDMCNIRQYLIENEDIVFFYNRKDLYDKLNFYLDNNNERHKIIINAKNKILKHLTYDSLISNLLSKIKESFLENYKNNIV